MNDKSKAPTFEIASKFVKKNDGEIITSGMLIRLKKKNLLL